jgi:hypothetical protein
MRLFVSKSLVDLARPTTCISNQKRLRRVAPGAVTCVHTRRSAAPAPATQAWSANANKPPQGITSIAYQSRAYACTFADRAAGAAFPGTSAGVDGRT